MTIKLKYLSLFSAFALSFAFVGCSDDPDVPQPVNVGVSVNYPAEVSVVNNPVFSFTNVTTRETSVFYSADEVSVLPGLYDIDFTATTTLHDGVEAEVRASKRSVEVSETSIITLDAYVNIAADDLVIAELFFTGSVTSTGGSYTGDDYIKLYNNTDHVVYADGLAIFESNFLTTTKYDYDPDIMPTDVAVDAVYVIPGSGTDHPVQPGEYLLIADNAIDHRTLNENSFDLSHADFEWYDVSSNAKVQDVDNADVPNMDKWYCYTKTVFFMHNRGFKSYGIARLSGGADAFLANNTYDYNYVMVTAAGTFPMSGSCYRIPNTAIVDMVNLSIDSNFAWTLCAPSVDAGWTGCGTIDKDPDRFFKSVRRKYLTTTEDGRVILQDTNNSTNDFNRSVVASEIEAQGTAINADGTKSTSPITVDGITVIQ